MRKYIFLIFILVLVFGAYFLSQKNNNAQEKSPYADQRKMMVENHLRERDITDETVLRVMGNVPRHAFVPYDLRDMAYTDQPLPIGEGQTISQPYVVAFMTQALELQGDEKVLEIGTGSGYQAAVLGEIVDEVYTIEIFESLGRRAGDILDSLGYDNVHLRIGDGYAGWASQAPFDAIIVTAAPKEIPQPLKDQLAEGGRMVVPIGSISQELMLLRKESGEMKQYNLLPVRFVPMIDKDGKQY